MISCRGVFAGYGRRIVLRRVNLELAPGRLTGLLGPNGTGKSTLLRTLARLLRPARGTVRLDGRDLYAGFTEREAARHIALVPQEEAAVFPMTVRELVQLGRTPFVGRFGWLGRGDERAAEEALAEMDLLGLVDRRMDELSGGERKRVQVARALAQEARVLVLDEPAAHLDIAHALDLFGLLKRLAEAGRTVLVASHELWLLTRFCDRVLLMSRGRVVKDGSPSRVLGSPAASRAFGVRITLKRAGGVVTPVISRR